MRNTILSLAVLCALLSGWFGANQVAKVWPFFLLASGVLFAVASRQKQP